MATRTTRSLRATRISGSNRITRLELSYVMCAIVVGVGLLACGGDDKGSSQESAYGASAGRSGTSAGTSGASGRGRGTAGAGLGIFAGQMCPMTEAEATGSCTPARGTCMFGDRICDCITEAMAWACWSPSDCPTSVPAEQSSCGVVGMTCSPTRGTNCSCTATGWDCGNQYCPPAEPALGSACEGGTGLCTYGARTCDCDNSVWVCWNPTTDCPTLPPADRAACGLDGTVCEYEGGTCECNAMSGWRCGRGVMNDVEDAGVPPAGGASAAAGTSGASTVGTLAGAGGAKTAGVGGAAVVVAGTGGVPAGMSPAGAAAP